MMALIQLWLSSGTSGRDLLGQKSFFSQKLLKTSQKWYWETLGKKVFGFQNFFLSGDQREFQFIGQIFFFSGNLPKIIFAKFCTFFVKKKFFHPEM